MTPNSGCITMPRTKDKLLFASYDFSNSGFVVIFQSFLFPAFLTTIWHGTPHDADVIWGWLVAGSSTLAILSGPFVGRIADRLGKARLFIILVSVAGCAAMLAPLALRTQFLMLAIAFILFNAIFELSQTIYDSFLTNYGKDCDEITALSTFSWGFGYLGGALFIASYLTLDRFGISKSAQLALLAGLFLILSIPSMIAFRHAAPAPELPRISLQDILRTKPPVPWLDLFVYWIIGDCVAGVIYFAPLYVIKSLGIESQTVGVLLLVTQVAAFPLTVLAGVASRRVGPLRTIRACLFGWLLALLGLFFAKTVTHVMLVMIPIAFVIGSTQAILRAHFASRVAKEQSGEGLGYYAVAQKSASVLAPLLVALTTLVTGSMRWAFLALAGLVVLAFLSSTFLSNQPDGPRRAE